MVKCRIIPKHGIPDLIKNKRIEYPCIMDLTNKEIRRCVSFADVYLIHDDGSEELLDEFFDDTKHVSRPIVKDPEVRVIDVIGLDNVKTIDVASVNSGGVDIIRIY